MPVLEEFLDSGGDIELRDPSIGMTLLGWAARRGHVDVVRMLLSRGASITAGDGRKRMALHRACSGCSPDVVKVLLEHGADPDARDLTWRTPLHRAARWGSAECTTLLLDAGADIEARDKELARTPLHFASRSGGIETTLVLLNNGADMNVKTVAGNTPLHLACDRGLVENVKLLLEWGADPNSKNEAGAVPAEVAAPWVEDSVKSTLKALLASSGKPSTPAGASGDAACQSRPKPAAECPECQHDVLRQTHPFNGDDVPGVPSSTNSSSTYTTPRDADFVREGPGKVKVCWAHRKRARPGEGGLPGLDAELGLGPHDGGGGGGSSGGSWGEKGEEDGNGEGLSPRKGMEKSRKKQLLSGGTYEGAAGGGGGACCSVQ